MVPSSPTAQTPTPEMLGETLTSRHLHPIPVLELLAAYGGDFWHSNALLCAALGGVGYSMEEQRIKVLAWSLQMGGQELILINSNMSSGG